MNPDLAGVDDFEVAEPRTHLHFGTAICGRDLTVRRRPRPRLLEIHRVLAPRERRWILRRLVHDLFLDRRPLTLAALAGCSFAVGWLLPLAHGMPLARSPLAWGSLQVLGLVLVAVAIGWWWNLLRDSLLQHLLVLRRCGACGHPEADRGPRLVHAEAFACRSWRCSECGSEWVAAGAFADAETRRDAA